jgi:hypothetical protein
MRRGMTPVISRTMHQAGRERETIIRRGMALITIRTMHQAGRERETIIRRGQGPGRQPDDAPGGTCA